MTNIEQIQIFLDELENKDAKFILNTNTGVLHTADCAKGLTGCEPVKAGHRKYYTSYENATNDVAYKSNHHDCLG